MPGIYIHIPFCKQACHYCDFHFSTQLKSKEAFLSALKTEIGLQKDFFKSVNDNRPISTIYFGGGTPSLLTADELKSVFEVLHASFLISPDAEITLEANPDDLDEKKIGELRETPINRLSIGIQSFFDEDLKMMNRAHVSKDGMRAVKQAQDKGFDNITIDLIYGLPALSNDKWTHNLDQAFDLHVQHISCYHLTIEERTALHDMVKKGKVKPLEDQQSVEQFRILFKKMKENEFIQYEISNFCKKGYESKHNSSYWLKDIYLGLGPSAHSYNGTIRQWNVSNNNKYIEELKNNSLLFEKEELTAEQKYNEYIMTSLRTIWGVDLEYIKKYFGDLYLTSCLKESEKYLLSGMIIEEKNKLFLTDEGKLIADKITSDLFTPP